MVKWTILDTGEVRYQERDDETIAAFLPGWHMKCPSGRLKGMTMHVHQGFDPDGTEQPAVVFADRAERDAFRLQGWALAELEERK